MLLRTTGIRQREKHIFNGKEDTRLKPQRVTPCLWKTQYKIYLDCQGMDQIVYVSYA